MTKYDNSKKNKFLDSIPRESIEIDTDKLTTKCKFNFAYFTKQTASQSFDEWDHAQLSKLLNKLKEYSKESLLHWQNEGIGGPGGRVLSLYGAFPKKNSDFMSPDHVPHQAEWGRFRLESSVRLVGFVIPGTFKDKLHPKTKARFDCNTFYVVFLDANHKFYKTEAK